MWEPSFVAMAVLLGTPAEEAAALLDPPRRDAAADLLQRLTDPRREVRARALALEIARVAAATDTMRLG